MIVHNTLPSPPNSFGSVFHWLGFAPAPKVATASIVKAPTKTPTSQANQIADSISTIGAIAVASP
jgi:hypothetical protein